MSIAMFNTAKFQEKLIEAKVDPNVAKAQADVLYEAMSQNVDSLATKEQVDERFDHLNNSLDIRFNNVDINLDVLEKIFKQEAKHYSDRFELHSNSIIKSINLLDERLNKKIDLFGEKLDKKIDVGFSEAKADRETIRKEIEVSKKEMQRDMRGMQSNITTWMFSTAGILIAVILGRDIILSFFFK